MFVFRDLKYKGPDDVLNFKMNIYLTYSNSTHRQLFFSESFALSGYERDYDNNRMLKIQRIVTFAFSG